MVSGHVAIVTPAYCCCAPPGPGAACCARPVLRRSCRGAAPRSLAAACAGNSGAQTRCSALYACNPAHPLAPVCHWGRRYSVPLSPGPGLPPAPHHSAGSAVAAAILRRAAATRHAAQCLANDMRLYTYVVQANDAVRDEPLRLRLPRVHGTDPLLLLLVLI